LEVIGPRVTGMQRTARIELDRFLHGFSARPLIPPLRVELGNVGARASRTVEK